ncbi:HNH endonuclease [Nonomuraea sp. NPDC059194]|uniref:HNH endonuclease n=1 Tax=Nonomuraea sp. NPDC059194 TaxID=3346764 RepID=UPI00368BF622
MKLKTEFSPVTKAKDGRHSWCKACCRVLAKSSYDPEKAREKHAAKKTSPEYIAMKKVAYDRWRKQYPERARAATKTWRDANQEHVRDVWLAWTAANPERWALLRRQHSKLRKLRKKNQSVGVVSYAAILERDGMVCHICAETIPTLDDLHFDHVVPLARGGEHSMANIRPAHAACNLWKSDKLPDELTLA